MSINAISVEGTPAVAARRWRFPRSAKLWIGLGIVLFFALLGFVGTLFTHDPNAISNGGLIGPAARHWLGTTQSGQDVFAQLLAGARGSLTIGLIIGVLA